MTKPIKLFKLGPAVAMSGHSFNFTAAQLAATAASYNTDLHAAPLVIGHPKLDDPKYGQIQALSFADGILSGAPANIDPAFAELVNSGRYDRVSASFYAPDSPSNPVPGVLYLRHVGFLGATPPGCKGLGAVSFAELEEGVIEFADPSPALEEDAELNHKGGDVTMTPEEMKLKEAELIARENKLKADENSRVHNSNVEFAEGLVKGGTLLAASKAALVGVLDFAAGIVEGDVIEFGEGTAKKSEAPLATIKNLFSTLPKVIEFAELGGGPEPGTVQKTIPANMAQYV